MQCMDNNIFRCRYLSLTMFSNRDVPRKFIPKSQWLNPLRYEIVVNPKGYNQSARMLVINSEGKYTGAIKRLFLY